MDAHYIMGGEPHGSIDLQLFVRDGLVQLTVGLLTGEIVGPEIPVIGHSAIKIMTRDDLLAMIQMCARAIRLMDEAEEAQP